MSGVPGIRRATEALAVQCDVVDPAACRSAVSSVVDHFGGVDILCNNAGITRISNFMDTPDEAYRTVMNVNYFGAVNMTRACIEELIKRKGLIQVTSSIAGFAPLIGRTAYCASKHALHGFFDTLRTELKSTGVGVLLVCPGFTRTGIADAAVGAIGLESRADSGREADPDSVGRAICRAIRKRKRKSILTPQGKLAWYVNRMAPRIYDRLMVRRSAPGNSDHRSASLR